MTDLMDRLPRTEDLVAALKERLPRADEPASSLGLSRTTPEPDTAFATLGAFAMGIAVGAALGVLFAPRPGRETRAVVGERTGRLAGGVRERLGGSHAPAG